MTCSLIVGDLHRNDNPRDAYRHDFQRHLRKTVDELRPDRVIFVGDITAAKDRHPSWLVNEIVDDFALLAQRTNVIINKGNHDYLEADHPFFRFLSHIDGIRWINRPKMIGDWLFLPHTYDYKRDWADLGFGEANMIIAHNTFEGAVSESGRRLSGIPTNIFPPGTYVIAGDIHKPQVHDVGPIIKYVGAPYTINFGDDYEPRMLLVDGNRIENLPCPGVRKQLLECTALDKGPNGKWRMDLPKKWDDLLHPGDILKVRVNLEMEHIADWQAIRSSIRETLGKAFVVEVVQPVVLARSTKRTKTKAHEQHSDTDLVKLYAKQRGLDEATIKAGINLVEA